MIIKFDLSTKGRLNESKDSKGFGSSNAPFKTKETAVMRAQLGDAVLYKNMKGYITGAIGEQVIVSVQFSTYTCDVNSKDLRLLDPKPTVIKPPFKFDERTQKVLFEQYVRCGLYMGSTNVKNNDCYVKYSDFRDAGPDDKINVMVEGQLAIMDKAHVRVYDDVNEFANPEHYVEGAIIDEATEEVVENVLINAEDYTSGTGEADMVRIIRGVSEGEDEPELDTLPKALLRTLSV